VTAFPKVVRSYEAQEGTTPGNRLWVVQRGGRRLAYIDRQFAEDGQRRVVSIHVVEDAELPKYPLSKKKSPGASPGRDVRVPPGDTAGASFAQHGQGRPASSSVAPKAGSWEDLQARAEDDLTVPPPHAPDPMTEPGAVRLDEDDLLLDTGVRVGAVHPRVCGEHTGTLIWNRFGTGSSPRVRGTPIRTPKRR